MLKHSILPATVLQLKFPPTPRLRLGSATAALLRLASWIRAGTTFLETADRPFASPGRSTRGRDADLKIRMRMENDNGLVESAADTCT